MRPCVDLSLVKHNAAAVEKFDRRRECVVAISARIHVALGHVQELAHALEVVWLAAIMSPLRRREPTLGHPLIDSSDGENRHACAQLDRLGEAQRLVTDPATDGGLGEADAPG